MVDKLVNFETAKLFHEKCFDQINELNLECRYAVSKDGYNRSLEYNGNDHFNVENVLDATLNTGKEYYLAPTQSQLQKWIRELHDIHIINNYVHAEDKNKYEVIVYNNKTKGWGVAEIYETYEEGLEDKLCEALKLIP